MNLGRTKDLIIRPGKFCLVPYFKVIFKVLYGLVIIKFF